MSQLSDSDAQDRRAKTSFILGLALILITVTAYRDVVGFSFVSMGDPTFVTENDWVQDGVTLESMRWAFATTETGFWQPVLWFSLMLDVELFGVWAGGFHLMNLLLHIVSVVLVFRLGIRWSAQLVPSAVAAGLFALHPLHVEAVAWVSQRKDLLSTMFALLTLDVYTSYAWHRGWGRYGLMLICFVLGLWSKSILVTLPFMMLLVDYWPLGRTSLLPAAVPGHPEPPKLHDLLLEKVPLFFLSGLFAAITYDAQYRMGAMAQRRASEESVQMSLVGYGWYLEKTVWPMGLGLFYPLDAVQPMLTDTPWLPVAVGVLLLLLTTLFGWLARGYPSLLIGWLWFVGTLLPVSGLIRFSPFAYADRFSYLPHSGLFLGTMIGIWSILRSRGGPKLADSLVGLAGLVILAGMGWLTYQRVQMWDSTETLLRRSLDRNANDNNALLSLAAWLQQEDRWPEARAIYLQSYALYPDRPERNLDLGRAMLRANELTEARKYFERLLELLPSDANYSMWAHVHLSMIELREGRRKEAEEHLRYAQGLNPLSPHPYHHAGELYDRYDEIAQAQKQYQTALTLAAQQRIPYLASYERLVRLLARHGQLNEAARIAQEWIDLGLRDSEPYFYQARLLTQNGELEQALSRTQSAIEFRRRELQYACFAGYLQHRLGQRDAKQTYQSVAAQHKGRQALREHIWELVTHAHSHFRDGKLALQLLEDHFEPEPAVPEELDAWAAAHAEVGDFDQAVRHAEKALALDAPAVVKQVRKDRLELYKHQKPCRFPDKPNQVR